MALSVRPALLSDIPWIVAQLREFDEFFGTNRRLFTTDEIVSFKFADFLKRNVVFVSEEDGKLTGFIAGFMGPHFMNPSITTLTQVFWWVAPAKRKTRAGLALLKQFVAHGRAHADWITMNIQTRTPVKAQTLERYGFRAQELTYLMEVG